MSFTKQEVDRYSPFPEMVRCPSPGVGVTRLVERTGWSKGVYGFPSPEGSQS